MVVDRVCDVLRDIRHNPAVERPLVEVERAAGAALPIRRDLGNVVLRHHRINRVSAVERRAIVEKRHHTAHAVAGKHIPLPSEAHAAIRHVANCVPDDLHVGAVDAERTSRRKDQTRVLGSIGDDPAAGAAEDKRTGPRVAERTPLHDAARAGLDVKPGCASTAHDQVPKRRISHLAREHSRRQSPSSESRHLIGRERALQDKTLQRHSLDRSLFLRRRNRHQRLQPRRRKGHARGILPLLRPVIQCSRGRLEIPLSRMPQSFPYIVDDVSVVVEGTCRETHGLAEEENRARDVVRGHPHQRIVPGMKGSHVRGGPVEGRGQIPCPIRHRPELLGGWLAFPAIADAAHPSDLPVARIHQPIGATRVLGARHRLPVDEQRPEEPTLLHAGDGRLPKGRSLLARPPRHRHAATQNRRSRFCGAKRQSCIAAVEAKRLRQRIDDILQNDLMWPRRPTGRLKSILDGFICRTGWMPLASTDMEDRPQTQQGQHGT